VDIYSGGCDPEGNMHLLQLKIDALDNSTGIGQKTT
jgi:hypothetical protein